MISYNYLFYVFVIYYRTTATKSIGKYQLARDFFNSLSEGGIDLDRIGAANYSLADLYRATAHTKEDMIVE